MKLWNIVSYILFGFTINYETGNVTAQSEMPTANAGWTTSTTPPPKPPKKRPRRTTVMIAMDIWTETTTPTTTEPPLGEIWTETTTPTTTEPPLGEIWTETTTPTTTKPPPKDIWTETTTPTTTKPPPKDIWTETTTPTTTKPPPKDIWTETTTPTTTGPPPKDIWTETTTPTTTGSPPKDIWTETTTPTTTGPPPKDIWTETTTPTTTGPPPKDIWTETTTPTTTGSPPKDIWTETTTPTTTGPPPKDILTETTTPTTTGPPPKEIWTETATPANGEWTETTTLPPKSTMTSKPLNPTTIQITTTASHVTKATFTHSPTPNSTKDSTNTTTTHDLPQTDIFHAKQLIHDFLSDKDVKVRPIDNQSNPIHIKTNFVPVSLIEFDTTNQKFSILGYFRLAWHDNAIRWTKSEYNGLRHMIVPAASVWKPNLIIWKSYSGNGVIGKTSDQIRLGRKGHTQWVPDGTYSVVCDVDIRYYPFDDQFCKIIYYAADETTDTVILNHDAEVDLEELKENENSAWIILSVTRKKILRKNNYFIEIEFHLTRRTNYAIFTLIVPLLMLASLNVGMFLVPIESGEKGGFAITIFLAYGIFISVLSDKLPHNSLQTSFFVVFITLLLLLSVLSVLYSVIQAKLVISVGGKDALIGCFRISSPKSNEHQSEVGTVKKSMTWSAFFHRMDIAIFVVLFIIVVLLSLGFFFVMLRRIAA